MSERALFVWRVLAISIPLGFVFGAIGSMP